MYFVLFGGIEPEISGKSFHFIYCLSLAWHFYLCDLHTEQHLYVTFLHSFVHEEKTYLIIIQIWFLFSSLKGFIL